MTISPNWLWQIQFSSTGIVSRSWVQFQGLCPLYCFLFRSYEGRICTSMNHCKTAKISVFGLQQIGNVMTWTKVSLQSGHPSTKMTLICENMSDHLPIPAHQLVLTAGQKKLMSRQEIGVKFVPRISHALFDLNDAHALKNTAKCHCSKPFKTEAFSSLISGGIAGLHDNQEEIQEFVQPREPAVICENCEKCQKRRRGRRGRGQK